MDPNARVILKVLNVGCCESCPKTIVKALRNLGNEDIQINVDETGTATGTIGHAPAPPTLMVEEITECVKRRVEIVPIPPPLAPSTS